MPNFAKKSGKKSLYVFILFLPFVLFSCGKKEEDEEKKIRKELELFQNLDRVEISRVFHANELNSFYSSVQRKCKLLDISINGFHTKHVPIGYTFVSVMNISMDIKAETESLEQLLVYIYDFDKKYVQVEELKIVGQQTGQHNTKITIKLLYKDYFDKDFLPDAVKALAGVTIDQLDFLKASVKIYKSRYSLIKKLSKYPIVLWQEKLKPLKQLPQNVYIKEFTFKNSVQSESVEILARAKDDADVVKAMNQFFANLKGYSDTFGDFSQSIREKPVGDGTTEARYVYSLNHDG